MHLLKPKRFSVAFSMAVMAVLVWAGTAFAASAQDKKDTAPQSASGATYVGADVCKGCHEDKFNQVGHTPHATSTMRLQGQEIHNCETCHGPGSEHVAGGGDKSKIFAFKGARAEVISARCLACHARTEEHGNFRRSYHDKSNVGCTSCHSPHYARETKALLIQPQPLLCYGCHSEIKAEFAKPFRHRVNERLLLCADCHNPHGGYRLTRSLRADAGEDQVCYKCHRDKQGPWLYEHLPVKTEGCVACHTPHGSTNPRMLRVWPVNTLCLQCHSPVPNSGTSPLPSLHNQSVKYMNCTLCHPAIHGSNGVETFEY